DYIRTVEQARDRHLPAAATQKSTRTPTWPVRFPEFSADCTVVNRPNSALFIVVLGDRKFGWLGRFVNVPSSRSRRRSLIGKVLAIPAAIATVPGPSRIPAPAF